MPLNKDWREFLELLNSNGVEYLVVGAFAVAFHGVSRYTADLVLTAISGVSFEEAWAHAATRS